MHAVAAHLRKELLGQRALLGSYYGLTFTSLAVVVWIMATVGSLGGAQVGLLTSSVGIGLVGVLAFAAPQCVRGEFTGRDDQFVRRLPGALRPAFVAKVLFVLGLTVAAVAVGCCVAWLLCTLTGRFPDRMFAAPTVPWPMLGLAALAGPWVLALSWWTPGGRMGLGVAVLIPLLLAVFVSKLLAMSPGLEQTAAGACLPWLSTPLAIAVGYVSFVLGRRGGGPLRSAKLGAAVLAVGLLPHTTWFGSQFHAYHHPNPEQHGVQRVHGCLPDSDELLVQSSGDPEHWRGCSFRLDPRTGATLRLDGTESGECEGAEWTAWPGARRFWRWRHSAHEKQLIDLATGNSYRLGGDEARWDRELPAELRSALATDDWRRFPVALPGGRIAVRDEAGYRWLDEQGNERRLPLPERTTCYTAGHAVMIHDVDRMTHTLFDFTSGQQVEAEWSVRGIALVSPRRMLCVPWEWQRIDLATGSVQPCSLPAAIVMTQQLCMLGDDEVLYAIPRDGSLELQAYDPAKDRVTPIRLPEELSRLALFHRQLAGKRDPRGRLWVPCAEDGEIRYLVVDPRTHTATMCAPAHGSWTLIRFCDDAALMHEDYRRIVRIDFDTNVRTVLFPLRDPEGK